MAPTNNVDAAKDVSSRPNLFALLTQKSARTKYRAQPVEVDGIRFHSKKEARYWQGLLLARRSGDLLFALRQVPFHLPGGVVYRVDFVEFWKNSEVRFVDVKGYQTRESKTKIRLVEALYPVTIILA